MLLFLVTPQILPVGSLVFALIAEKFDLKQLSFHSSVHAQMVFKFLGCLVKEKNYYEVTACFFENTY
jgi:hypothetical protein